MTTVRARVAATAVALSAFAACGKKGPPLPPLHIVPDVVTELGARRSGDEVRLRFVLPVKNQNGPEPVNLDRVEILAATLAPGAVAPPNREFLSSKYVVGTLPAKRPLAEGEPENPADTRPGPGDVVVFVEQLTEDKLRPQFTTLPVPAPAAAPNAAAGATPAAGAAPAPAMRIYTVRGIARNGRPGQPSARIQVPLVPPPAGPTDLAVKFTESAIQMTWTAPVVEGEGAKPPAYNVYAAKGDVPLNKAPLTSPAFERPGLEFGREECFTVRSVQQAGQVSIESSASAPVCVTPSDVFPPAAPTGLSAVAMTGAVNLIWQANSEADLAGYLVLRAEAPGETLQPVTATPVRETTYRDTTVKPGVRYVYAIVAVDRATPPNTSAQSSRVEETAR